MHAFQSHNANKSLKQPLKVSRVFVGAYSQLPELPSRSIVTCRIMQTRRTPRLASSSLPELVWVLLSVKMPLRSQ